MLVFDWDVHHGNGTEAIFAASTEVLYASIHQCPLYPGTGAAQYDGRGRCRGLHDQPSGPGRVWERVFLALTEHIVVPVARSFKPGLIIISAGFDAHRDDPLADCEVDEIGYAGMTAAVRDVAAELGAPVLVCLEGGYDLGALGRSVLATVRSLADSEPAPGSSAAAAAPHLERVARRWPALAGA